MRDVLIRVASVFTLAYAGVRLLLWECRRNPKGTWAIIMAAVRERVPSVLSAAAIVALVIFWFVALLTRSP